MNRAKISKPSLFVTGLGKSEILNPKQIHPRPSQMSGMKLGFCSTTWLRSCATQLYILVVLLLVLGSLTLSCTKMPPNIGRSRDVVVISTKVDTNVIMNNLQIYNYLPQKEGLFSFVFAADTATDKYCKFHTIFLYGSLEDEFINMLLDPEAEEATKNDTFTLFKLNNLWSKGQLAIILAVSKPDYIETGLLKYKNLISKILENNYYLRIKENYYNTAFDKKTKNDLKRFGITFDFRKGWLIDSTYRDDNFIFVHAHFPDRSVYFYKEKVEDKLTSTFAIDKRNSLTKKYYNGDYLLKDLTDTEKIEFKDMKGIKLNGVWQNDSLVAGGPFVSYFLVKKDTLYIIDGMLFNPGERKSDYFTKLKVMLNSFELITNN